LNCKGADGVGIADTNYHFAPWIIAFISAVLLISIIVPPFQTPDEPTHLAECLSQSTCSGTSKEVIEESILDLLPRYEFWKLVQFPEPEQSPQRFYEAPLLRIRPSQSAKPLLYYRLSGWVLDLFQIQNPIDALFALRMMGCCFSLIVFGLCLAIIRASCPSYPAQITALSAMAVPQYLFMAGALNPAVLSWISAGFMILGSLYLLNPAFRYRSWVYIIGGFVLATVSHRAALTVLGAPIIAVLIRFTEYRRSLDKPLRIFVTAASLSAMSMAVWICITWCCPHLIRRCLITSIQTLQQGWIHLSPDAMNGAFWKQFWLHYHKSVWLSFGWLKIHASSWFYWLVVPAYLIPLIGYTRMLCSGNKRQIVSSNHKKLMILAIAAAGSLWGGALMFLLQGNLSQGRYLYAAWPAFAVLSATGWMEAFPVKYHRLVSVCVVFLTWSMAVYSIWGVLIPGYYFSP
jgi:hypothetical protein